MLYRLGLRPAAASQGGLGAETHGGGGGYQSRYTGCIFSVRCGLCALEQTAITCDGHICEAESNKAGAGSRPGCGVPGVLPAGLSPAPRPVTHRAHMETQERGSSEIPWCRPLVLPPGRTGKGTKFQRGQKAHTVTPGQSQAQGWPGDRPRCSQGSQPSFGSRSVISLPQVRDGGW